MNPIKNNSTPLDQYLQKGEDTPIKRYLRGEDNSGRVDINVHYSSEAGSDPLVMNEIAERVNAGTPIALRSEKSSIVVFVPQNLTAYWFGKEKSYFRYSDRQSFFDGIKLQYLTHKELLSTELLLEISELILWEGKSQPSKPMLNL